MEILLAFIAGLVVSGVVALVVVRILMKNAKQNLEQVRLDADKRIEETNIRHDKAIEEINNRHDKAIEELDSRHDKAIAAS